MNCTMKTIMVTGLSTFLSLSAMAETSLINTIKEVPVLHYCKVVDVANPSKAILYRHTLALNEKEAVLKTAETHLFPSPGSNDEQTLILNGMQAGIKYDIRCTTLKIDDPSRGLKNVHFATQGWRIPNSDK